MRNAHNGEKTSHVELCSRNVGRLLKDIPVFNTRTYTVVGVLCIIRVRLLSALMDNRSTQSSA